MTPAEAANLPRYPAGGAGFYEVWFVEVQDILRETGLWLRYTLRAPRPGGGEPVAEVWAMFYDRAHPQENFGLKRTAPLSAAHLARDRFHFALGEASIDHYGCRGTLEDGGRRLAWDLSWSEDELLHHLPYRGMYGGGFPRTKVLSPHFDLRASGYYRVGHRELRLSDCPGEQSHLWGTQHAKRWRWCHANTFLEDPSAAFEALTVQVQAGPIATPPLTLFALKLGGRTHRFHGPLALVRTNESRTDAKVDADHYYPVSRWTVGGGDAELRFRGEISAPTETFLGAEYVDPDGSRRYCAHSKLATARLEVMFPDAKGRWRVGQTLVTDASAALEFVGAAADPRVPVTIL